ncbi:hypothetical protein PRIPAC_87345 [Pristionchus pacificus]|nr:hypothetical protein PRIPAC_87345 [Pristionchus pacificus]
MVVRRGFEYFSTGSNTIHLGEIFNSFSGVSPMISSFFIIAALFPLSSTDLR